ncbi:MAG TPA: hypothetical protein VG148_04180 [Pyrinomonadaceae bacterium]|nr:hypothetical protein [Pyrinomonadaceae bacterium]
MAPQEDDFSEYPREVRSGTQKPSAVYTRLADHYAVRRGGTAAGEGDEEFEVFRAGAGERGGEAARGQARPVYALRPGGAQAVPTGRVFIRFGEGVAVGERRREIEQAGYEIAQALDYAPHAAWLRARSGRIADALKGVEALGKIAGVENVEPQMLMPRAYR